MGLPTHIQVVVKSARNLKVKGKDGTNDAFVIISLGKEKFRTSVKEKVTKSAEWLEECELMIPRQGNTAEVVLKVMHQGNKLGSHHFLGMVTIPLRDFDEKEIMGGDSSAQPVITKWYLLKCKPNQNKTDYRGELQVAISFVVRQLPPKENKSASSLSVNDSARSDKRSLQSLNKFTNKIGGSLMSLGKNDRRVWKKNGKGSTNSLPRNIFERSKIESSLHSMNSSCCSDSLENLGGGEVLRKKLNGPIASKGLSSISSNVTKGSNTSLPNKQILDKVKEEDGDEWNTKLTSSEQESLNVPKRQIKSVIKDFMSSQESLKDKLEKKSPILESNRDPKNRSGAVKETSIHDNYNFVEKHTSKGDENIEKTHNGIKSQMFSNVKRGSKEMIAKTNKFFSSGMDEIPPPKPPRIVIGRELSENESEFKGKLDDKQVSAEEKRIFLNSFQDKSREDLIEILINLSRRLDTDRQKLKELEEYLASLLFKVITNAPDILEADPTHSGTLNNNMEIGSIVNYSHRNSV